MNAGQTCIAPDYVLVHQSIHEAFKAELLKQYASVFGDGKGLNPDVARIVNKFHFD